MQKLMGMVAAGCLLATASAQAAGVADFYKGKQVNVVIGYSPGGGYDVYARLLARSSLVTSTTGGNLPASFMS